MLLSKNLLIALNVQPLETADVLQYQCFFDDNTAPFFLPYPCNTLSPPANSLYLKELNSGSQRTTGTSGGLSGGQMGAIIAVLVVLVVGLLVFIGLRQKKEKQTLENYMLA